jgi:hypothetical protein
MTLPPVVTVMRWFDRLMSTRSVIGGGSGFAST